MQLVSQFCCDSSSKHEKLPSVTYPKTDTSRFIFVAAIVATTELGSTFRNDYSKPFKQNGNNCRKDRGKSFEIYLINRKQQDTQLAEVFFILSLLFRSLFRAVFTATSGKKTVAVKTAMKRLGNRGDKIKNLC